jgi:3-hydroxybutyryl-CoA dehydratase
MEVGFTAPDLTLTDIVVGDSRSFSHTCTSADVEAFAHVSGDTNPLHLDEAYAATTPFGQRLVHGMFLGSLCSRFVGMELPGKRCLYLSQSLVFKKPVFIGDTVVVTGTVTAVSVATKIITIAFSFTKEGVEVITGEARTQII